MKIRRRTNPNNIDVWFSNQLGPITVWFCVGNKLGTELFRALVRGVADRNDSDILHCFQRGQVTLFDDIPGADETNIQFSATHWHGNAVSDKRNDRLFDAIDNFLRWQPESLARSPRTGVAEGDAADLGRSELTPTILVPDRKREDGVCMVFSKTNPKCLWHFSVKPAPGNGPIRSAADKCVECSGPTFRARLESRFPLAGNRSE